MTPGGTSSYLGCPDEAVYQCCESLPRLPYCTFYHLPGGWCKGGPNTRAQRADGTEVESLIECWQECTVRYRSSLVAVDYWPNAKWFSYSKCYCQTACTSVTTEDASAAHPSYLAVMPSHLPASSGLTCEPR